MYSILSKIAALPNKNMFLLITEELLYISDQDKQSINLKIDTYGTYFLNSATI